MARSWKKFERLKTKLLKQIHDISMENFAGSTRGNAYEKKKNHFTSPVFLSLPYYF